MTEARVAVLAALAACAAPRAPPASRDGAVWRYEVRVEANLDLEIEAELTGAGEATPLRVEEAAMPFVDVRARGPRPRYRVRAREAAAALADVDVAWPAAGAVFAPPSSWLLRPEALPAEGTFRFHVTTAPGIRFATAVHRAGDLADTYEGPATALEDASFAAFGAIDVERLPGREVEVVSARSLPASRGAVARWLDTSTAAITDVLGRAPRGTLFVAPGTDGMRGKTLGDGGGGVLFRLGPRVDDRSLVEDWVAAHELVHLSFPALAPVHGWFGEGLATYVEPVARARAGLVGVERIWQDMVVGMPEGLPAPGEQGLDGARAWGRLYWGGALYFLLADLAIREESGGRSSLDTALRAIVSQSRGVEEHWEIERVLDVGDRATGLRVLSDLYARLGRSTERIDLDALWIRLGVRRAGDRVHLDAAAPLAAIRRAITERTPR